MEFSSHGYNLIISSPTKEVRTDRGIQIAIGFYVFEEQVVIYSYLLFRPDGNQKAHLVG